MKKDFEFVILCSVYHFISLKFFVSLCNVVLFKLYNCMFSFEFLFSVFLISSKFCVFACTLAFWIRTNFLYNLHQKTFCILNKITLKLGLSSFQVLLRIWFILYQINEQKSYFNFLKQRLSFTLSLKTHNKRKYISIYEIIKLTTKRPVT